MLSVLWGIGKIGTYLKNAFICNELESQLQVGLPLITKVTLSLTHCTA